jgi:hypothetical protein
LNTVWRIFAFALLLATPGRAEEPAWTDLIPVDLPALQLNWQDFSEQGGPSDQPLSRVRTNTWWVVAPTGSLHCSGSPYSVLLTRESFADFELECELRYLPKPGEVDWQGKKRGNTGIFVRIDRELPDTLFLMHQVELATSDAFARIHGGRVSSDGTLYRMAEKVSRHGKWVDEKHHIPGRFSAAIKQEVATHWPDPGPELPPAGKNIEYPLNEWNH